MGRLIEAKVENASEEVQIKWTSEDSTIAKVSAAGAVWGVHAGETFAVATVGGGIAAAKCKIVVSDNNEYKFRITIKDKGIGNFTFNRPEEFLSLAALARRRKHNVPLDSADIPISPQYIAEIEKTGAVVVAKSKWLKTITVHCPDVVLENKLRKLPFVSEVVPVWERKRSLETSVAFKESY